MTGRDIALATLYRERVPYPCLTQAFVTNSRYYEHINGRPYWDDPEGSFVEFVERVGANLIIQWYYPGEAQRKLECGEIMHAPRQHEAAGFRTPEDVLRAIEALPDDADIERGFNLEQAALDYANGLRAHQELVGDHALVIQHFGQADFMGPYNAWGYENYLAAAAMDPQAMRRYYHYTALHGRLYNQAIALACEKHGVAPFVYTGQDI